MHEIHWFRILGDRSEMNRLRYTIALIPRILSFLYRLRNMTLTEIGLAVRAARHSKNLTQAALAASLGMSRATLSQLENGTIGDLGIRKLAQICDRVNLEIGVSPRTKLRPTLHEAYEINRAERAAAFAETDASLRSEGRNRG